MLPLWKSWSHSGEYSYQDLHKTNSHVMLKSFSLLLSLMTIHQYLKKECQFFLLASHWRKYFKYSNKIKWFKDNTFCHTFMQTLQTGFLQVHGYRINTKMCTEILRNFFPTVTKFFVGVTFQALPCTCWRQWQNISGSRISPYCSESCFTFSWL